MTDTETTKARHQTMGYIRHNAIIVTGSGYALDGQFGITAPDIDSFRQSLPEKWQRLVIGPVQSIVNDYRSFVFLPDGSKEGSEDSELGDRYRERFVDLFSFSYDDGSSPYEVLVVDARFGGDEPGAGLEPELIVTANPHVKRR